MEWRSTSFTFCEKIPKHFSPNPRRICTVIPKIRVGNEEDHDQLGEVMFDAVRNGRSAYTAEQCEAWVPQVRRGSDWSKRLAAQTIFVAELDDEIVGFLSLGESGYVDLAFIRPKHQGTGLFRLVYDRLEQTARERNEKRLWVHASLTAQPAFAAMGFDIVREELVEIRGQTFRRFEMEKYL